MTNEPVDVEASEPDDIQHPFTLPDDGLDRRPAEDGPEDLLSALLGGGGGAGGGIDFGALMEQASQMQTQLLAAHEEAASTVVEGVSGGGVVKVTLTGGFDFQSVSIDPSAVDPDDVEMLQDLVLAALRHASEQIAELQQGPGVDLGGLGLGGLFGGS